MAKKILCIIVLMLALVCLLASCGDNKDKTTTHTHNFGEWKTTKAATCTDDGIEERYCIVENCEESETQTISATGHAYVNGYCSKCETIYDGALEEQREIVRNITYNIIGNIEDFSYRVSGYYENAWYFSIYNSYSYFSYESLINAFSSYVQLDSYTVDNGAIQYLQSLGKEPTEANRTVAIRSIDGAIGIIQFAVELTGQNKTLKNLVTEAEEEFKKINPKVVGAPLYQAVENYMNATMDLYNFAKVPSGNYNSYKSYRMLYYSYCYDYKSPLYDAINSKTWMSE